MNLNEELTKHPEQKYLKIKDFIKNYGSRSSILLMEAYLLVKHNPGYLNQADVFEMQLMSFALHHDLITKETAKQAGIVFSRCRGFQKQVFCILEKCYEISQSEECLQAICNILIKGNCTGEFAFSWYRRGIEKKLRITQLYEYYMYSIPDGYTELLPDGALKYFMYQNQLDYRKKALLYANIIAHREECPKVYKEYKKLMEQFVLEQLLKRHINEHLAVIYRDVLSEEVMNDELRQALADVMFTCRVTCKSPDIRQVFVYHKQMKKPGIYPVVDGTAYVLCCTQDAEVYLEDDKKNYYVAADHCTVRPLLSMEFCENLCKEMDNTAKLLYQCSKNEHFINQEDVELLLGFLAREDVSDRYREKMRYRLMLHFYKQYDMDALDKILQVMDERLLTKEQYEKYIELLIVRGMYKKAYTLICDRGSEHISPKKIVKMLSRMIAAREPEAEEELLALAFYVFENGKYDEIVLEYLTQYYNGSTKNMLQIWRAARRFEARVYDLPERLLAQVLFTGYYFDNVQEVFEACCREYAGALVIRAYIAQGAYQYLVKDMVVSESIFTCIQREYKNGEPLHDVCKLALLKYFSECGELSEEQLSVVQELLLEYFGRNIYMNFFGNFEERLLLPFLQTQKICVEYKTNPKYKVKIHYILEQPGNQNQNYMIEDMECTLEGIFVKEFVLFFGETLQYYITEEYQRSEQLTESRSITNAQVGISEKISKFGMLNDICVSNSLKDEQTLYSLMKKYALQENMAEHIFEPL